MKKKRGYFDVVKPLRSTIQAFANENQIPIEAGVDYDIVGVTIDQIHLADDDDALAWSRVRAGLRLNDCGSQYVLTIKNPVQFLLIVDYLRVGLSFRMALSVMTKTTERTGLAFIGSCSSGIPSKYAWFVCAMNLQK